MASNVSKRPDPRRELGATVYTKASNVTSPAECQRRFGSAWKNMWVRGVVTCLSIEENTTSNRTTTFVTSEYEFGNNEKNKNV